MRDMTIQRSFTTVCALGTAVFAVATALPVIAYAQSTDAKARTVTVDTRVSAGRMNLRLNGGNGYTPIARPLHTIGRCDIISLTT